MPIFCIDFHDDGPDAKGRRRFTLFWKAYRPFYDDKGRETGWGDGVRAQEFHADPSRYTREQSK